MEKRNYEAHNLSSVNPIAQSKPKSDYGISKNIERRHSCI